MNLSRAISRGMHFGAALGMTIAIGGVFLATGTLFAPMLLPVASTLSPSLVMVGIESIAGTLVGAAAGGALFGSTHLVTHMIPGLPKLLGEPPEPKRRLQVAVGRNRTVDVNEQELQFNPVESKRSGTERRSNFGQMIEMERIRDENQDRLEQNWGR